MSDETPRSPLAAMSGDIAGFDAAKLKKTETQEKNPLPNKEDISNEKIHLNLVRGVETFEKTKLCQTQTVEHVCLPDASAIQAEKQHVNLVSGIEQFDKSGLQHAKTAESSPKEMLSHEAAVRQIAVFNKEQQLKHTETQEKNVLPDKTVITTEKTIKGIEGFDRTQLKHAETEEKGSLPDQAIISQERAIKGIEDFDKSKLRHSYTDVKNPLPDQEAIDEERRHSQGPPS